MARIRSLKPEFWADEKLSPLTPLDRLVFLGLVSQADDEGRLVDSVRLIDGLLFPMTEDSCAESLEILASLGSIDRGVTASGQKVIQVIGWKKHQRIDKPNPRGALPTISISTNRRRKIPDTVREAIYERDGGICQLCGVEVQIGKRDRYDSNPALAEIDHILAVVDGGTNDPQNLRLSCLSCNRSKAGADARERSAKRRGSVVEDSTTDSAKDREYDRDLRSTIKDQLPSASEKVARKKSSLAEDEAFEKWWAGRWKRAGSNEKKPARRAWNARRNEGCTAEAMTAARDRYIAFLKATERAGTEYAKMASSFLGDPSNFENEWAPPPPQQNANRFAGTEAERARQAEREPTVQRTPSAAETMARISGEALQLDRERANRAKVDAWSKANEKQAAELWDEVQASFADNPMLRTAGLAKGVAEAEYRRRVLALLEQAGAA